MLWGLNSNNERTKLGPISTQKLRCQSTNQECKIAQFFALYLSMIYEDSFKLDLLFLCTYKKWEIPGTIIRTFPTNFFI